MYSAGIGHLFDSSKPDLPLLSRKRFDLWKEYLSSLPALIPHSKETTMQSLIEKLEASQMKACGQNGYNLQELRTLVSEHLARIQPSKRVIAFDRSLKGKGCQAIIAHQSRLYEIDPAPSCEKTWSIYRDIAIQEFDAYDQSHPEAPSRASTHAPLFTASPFSRVRHGKS